MKPPAHLLLNRFPIGVSRIFFAMALVLLGGCGGGPGEFRVAAYGYAFDYPGSWTLTRSSAFTPGSATNGEQSVTVALKEPYDQATLARYKLKKTLPAGANGNALEANRVVQRLALRAKGAAEPGKAVKYGGTPGYQFTLAYPAGNGTRLTNQLTLLFRGNDEFQISCQFTTQGRSELLDGCDQILRSLKFS
jgi:hypothetical protein